MPVRSRCRRRIVTPRAREQRIVHGRHSRVYYDDAPALFYGLGGPGGEKGRYNPGPLNELLVLGLTPNQLIQWTPFNVPRNASMVFLMAVGGGASGSGGALIIDISACGGTGGSGSGAMAKLLIPARFLPQNIYYQPAAGTLGALGNATGTAGNHTAITDKPGSTTLENLVLISGNNQAQAGSLGTTTPTTGSGGAGESGSTDTVYTSLGEYSYTSGQSGGSGGNGTDPTIGPGLSWGITGLIVSGGGGSAGTDNTLAAGCNGIAGGPFIGTTTPANNAPAPNGQYVLRPLAFQGGNGGGCSSNETGGGNGGNGSWGCGAGAGAPAQGTGNEGGGGNGGPGFLYIAWW